MKVTRMDRMVQVFAILSIGVVLGCDSAQEDREEMCSPNDGVSYPECPAGTMVLTGTIEATDEYPYWFNLDPFDYMFLGPSIDLASRSTGRDQIILRMPNGGKLDFYWNEAARATRLRPVTGRFYWPWPWDDREIKPGSTLWYDNLYFRFNVVLEGGHFVGCMRP